jgi:hypothetical protein
MKRTRIVATALLGFTGLLTSASAAPIGPLPITPGMLHDGGSGNLLETSPDTSALLAVTITNTQGSSDAWDTSAPAAPDGSAATASEPATLDIGRLAIGGAALGSLAFATIVICGVVLLAQHHAHGRRRRLA